jgi:hypothetical protein
VLAVAIVWALLVPATDWLAHHDIGSAKGSLAGARDAARGRLLTLGAGLLAAAALLFTARNFTLSRRTFELTEQGQVTDRYTELGLTEADRTELGLTEADLTDTGLTAADLTRAMWPAAEPVPEGWMIDGDSGRLKRAGRLSEVTAHYLW